MPEFTPSEAKTALAPITVMPSGLNCEAEIFLGPDETTKVVTSGRIPFTSTGVSQNIRLPITMPPPEGTYHIYLDVYAEGLLVAAYQAIEDVVIKAIAPVPWTYSNVLCRLGASGVGAWPGVFFWATVTNTGDRQVTRTLALWRRDNNPTWIEPPGYWGWLWSDWKVVRTKSLTLAPGESFEYSSPPPGTADLVAMDTDVQCYLVDSDGYESPVAFASRIRSGYL